MKRPHKTSVFFFRRDLRLEDNLGLLQALEVSEQVIPCFVFDPRQIDQKQNGYFSAPAFHFLLTSLCELDEALQERGAKLYIFYGDPAQITESLISKDGATAVFVSKDYTPFARTRDSAIADICERQGASFTRVADAALSPLEDIRTNENKLYTVFTPFMKKAMQHEVAAPRKHNFSNYVSGALTTPTTSLADFTADIGARELLVAGGRKEALRLLNNLSELKNYQDSRNLPATKGTSRLSAHHKFGTISIRETYKRASKTLGAHNQYVAELYWRDFYYYIAYHFPDVFKQSFLPWANHLKWINDQDQFKAWCAGMTGVPLVDAGMRELNHTGWIHNRARMIVASYLTKNLLIDWRWGECYFAQNLIDYDPAQNNGGWQWSASTGADPRPLRIFNPYTQATKYDPDAAYIKHWLPELAHLDESKLSGGKALDFSTFVSNYPAPLIDQKESYLRAMETYKQTKAAYQQTQTT